jgi:hypothetical protein
MPLLAMNDASYQSLRFFFFFFLSHRKRLKLKVLEVEDKLIHTVSLTREARQKEKLIGYNRRSTTAWQAWQHAKKKKKGSTAKLKL